MVESALKIVDGVTDDCGEIISNVSFLDTCKVALDVFTSTTRVYMSRNDQSFFQAVNARFKIRNVFCRPV
ncbi:hypothetical protein HDF13_002393 [Edaphobacter lichenicola]|uniref:Uncharacterized protein n=1 Tax=Tunturiibacter gelidiferens TaxID=3069689 RepID=A0ACC5NZU5_9BACT|nr:hypothetical protein [Edaphobacter lichenicola]